MPKIVIDITELANWDGELTGVPRVMSELCSRFKIKKDNITFAKWDSGLGGLMEVVEEINSKKHNKVATKITGLLKNNNLSKELFVQKNDILLILADWHSSDINFVEYLLKKHDEGVLLIQVVYDLLPIVTPQYSGHATEYVTRYARTVYPLCSLIMAISENTKKDIIGWLSTNGLKVPSVEVIRLGDDFHKAKSVMPKAFNDTIINNYILCVGTIEARKNHMLLYYVYRLAFERKIKLPNLIVVGRAGWHAENIYEMLTGDPEVNGDIKVMQNINDNELSWLYDNSLFSIYPSFYEGWGLPVAESVRRGKVCLSSNMSSLPEIAGSLIKYFNPYSTDECLEAIVELANPTVLKEATGKLTNYKATSWDDTFDEVRAIINRYEQ